VPCRGADGAGPPIGAVLDEVRDYALVRRSGSQGLNQLGGTVFPGIGTVVNVTTVLVGSALGVLIGHRLPQRTRDVVTDGLGLVTLLIAGSAAVSVSDPALRAAVGGSAPMLIVLASVLVGGIAGSLLRIEERLEEFGGNLQERLTRRAALRHAARGLPDQPDGGSGGADRQRFIEGFVTASLVFCVGPLTVLGALNDGLGNGADQLFLKSALDGFAAIAFAASLGWGVAASALALIAVQGPLTALGALLGDVLPEAHVAALTATGGLLLVGVALRLLRIKQLPVGDLLPALLVAPALTALVVLLR
jgi:uncharacterized membrane protein YqgA involved in biofilm formation